MKHTIFIIWCVVAWRGTRKFFRRRGNDVWKNVSNSLTLNPTMCINIWKLHETSIIEVFFLMPWFIRPHAILSTAADVYLLHLFTSNNCLSWRTTCIEFSSIIKWSRKALASTGIRKRNQTSFNVNHRRSKLAMIVPWHCSYQWLPMIY